MLSRRFRWHAKRRRDRHDGTRSITKKAYGFTRWGFHVGGSASLCGLLDFALATVGFPPSDGRCRTVYTELERPLPPNENLLFENSILEANEWDEQE